jgi:hypothetical protein
METHLLFFQFGCGHEYYDSRRPGGVSDWNNCLCESCQPYHAAIVVNHPCRHCGGSFSYLKDALQAQLSEQEAQEKKNAGVPLFNADRATA